MGDFHKIWLLPLHFYCIVLRSMNIELIITLDYIPEG